MLNSYYQVFIEPKGKHLAGDDNDGWKEKFLEDINKKYGRKGNGLKILNSDNYLLIGLPFFNDSDQEMKNKFESAFETEITKG